MNNTEGAASAAEDAANRTNEPKTPQMECQICLKVIADQDLMVTPCGHVFCSGCIKEVIDGRAACPTCNRPARSIDLKPLYLPM